MILPLYKIDRMTWDLCMKDSVRWTVSQSEDELKISVGRIGMLPLSHEQVKNTEGHSWVLFPVLEFRKNHVTILLVRAPANDGLTGRMVMPQVGMHAPTHPHILIERILHSIDHSGDWLVSHPRVTRA